jgi:hypothetical protein
MAGEDDHDLTLVDSMRMSIQRRRDVAPAEVRLRWDSREPSKPMEGVAIEAPPLPSDEMPISPHGTPSPWTPQRWEIWCLLHEGYSSKQVAKQIGCNIDTVSKLRTVWRRRYGMGITPMRAGSRIRDVRYKNPTSSLGRSPEIRSIEVIEELDQLALNARQIVQGWFDSLLDPNKPGRVDNLNPDDIKKIQEIGFNSQKAAMELLSPVSTEKPKGSSASAAMKGLNGAAPRGRKGDAAASAGSVASDLRTQLTRFREAKGS